MHREGPITNLAVIGPSIKKNEKKTDLAPLGADGEDAIIGHGCHQTLGAGIGWQGVAAVQRAATGALGEGNMVAITRGKYGGNGKGKIWWQRV